MYFSFFKLKKWGKKTVAARRHNCAVLLEFSIIGDSSRVRCETHPVYAVFLLLISA